MYIHIHKNAHVYEARFLLVTANYSNKHFVLQIYVSWVRFSGRPVANGTQKWLQATIFDYIGMAT